ncbi:hypothetical protein Ppb6_04149 [Photorhabdus australis subsp. thailandensis]|uniref:Uncharacterized protein n=1 Tax=Photorhabdus australis subsp. thailandensis TaxID=2805096 RepID=A0A1C0TYA7_9GAMM|nr:hypothetical protein [Photorhabdus australis]OCQ50660.1 hypothetical protein Ppb6_04149 [Photorhabdus australis subsp. thailandensis]
MDSKLFARLVESMTQMNGIINGECVPSFPSKRKEVILMSKLDPLYHIDCKNIWKIGRDFNT